VRLATVFVTYIVSTMTYTLKESAEKVFFFTQIFTSLEVN